MQPKIEVKSFDDGKDLTYTMEVEVLPDFKIKDFKGCSLTKMVAEPDKKSIDDALKRLAENNQTTKPVEGKRGAKDGDTVVIDFHGRTADDNVEHEGMHAHGHHLLLGSGSFIPGFEDQLKGKKAGDNVEVKVAFPENYGAQELAGRDAIFDVEVKELREPGEAKVDDEFAKSLGMDDLEALKKAIGEQLGKEYDMHSRIVMKKQLMDYLDDNHKFDVPPGMLEMEHKNIMDQLDLERQRNPEAKKELSKKEEQEYKDIADRRVRLGLILSEIGNENNIQVSEPELQQAVITEAQRYPGQEKDVFDYYSKNRQALESLRAPLFEDKVVNFIFELAEVKEKEVLPEELVAAVEGDEEKPKKKKPASSSKSKSKTATKDKPKTTAKKKPAAKSKKSSAGKKKKAS